VAVADSAAQETAPALDPAAVLVAQAAQAAALAADPAAPASLVAPAADPAAQVAVAATQVALAAAPSADAADWQLRSSPLSQRRAQPLHAVAHSPLIPRRLFIARRIARDRIRSSARSSAQPVASWTHSPPVRLCGVLSKRTARFERLTA